MSIHPLFAGLLLFAAVVVPAASCRSLPGQEVRFEPTPLSVVRRMLSLAAVGPRDVVFDLGSGDGRIVIMAATDFGARGVGIDIDPSLVARARETARAAGVAHRVEFRVADMYATNLQAATVVALFLHPEPNLKLRPKLRAELRSGARVVSYMWHMGDWPADVKEPAGRRGLFGRPHIYLWRIP